MSEPLLLKPGAAARLLGISRTKFYRWSAVGRLPLPVKIDGAAHWRSRELAAWVEAGCPERAVWQARRAEGV